MLKEVPLESFNEYVFAVTSHLCYREGEDTSLTIIKETHSNMGIFPDSKMPHTKLSNPSLPWSLDVGVESNTNSEIITILKFSYSGHSIKLLILINFVNQVLKGLTYSQIMNSDQLKDASIMNSNSFLAFILCRSTVSKPNLTSPAAICYQKVN